MRELKRLLRVHLLALPLVEFKAPSVTKHTYNLKQYSLARRGWRHVLATQPRPHAPVQQ